MKRLLFLIIFCVTSVTSMFAASAVIDKIWLEHNVTQNGEKGMIVHAKIWMKGVLNHRMHIDAYFDSPAGCGVMDTNGRYRADNGVAASVMNINNEYDDGHFDDLKLFMPYSELHQDYDNPDMACHIFIHDETAGAVLAKSEFVKFSYSTGRKAPANASRANNNINDTAGGSVYTEVRNTVFGEETWYHNPDGSAMVVTRRKCLYCSGTGQCPICFGAQGRWANGMWYACQSCAGLNGLCRQCFEGVSKFRIASRSNMEGQCFSFGPGVKRLIIKLRVAVPRAKAFGLHVSG